MGKIALVFLVLLQAAACARTPVAEQPRPASGASVLRLLSYNVNYGIPGDGETMDAIHQAKADLVLLQETNVAWERALRARLAPEFPHMAFRHRGGAGGLAVLSRRPLASIEFLAPAGGGGWFPAARMVVETAFGRVQVLSVHLRPAVSDSGSLVNGHFSTPEIRATEIDSFYARLVPELPTLIAGDFNEEEDGSAVKLLLGRGMLSALQRFAPQRPTWRWPTVLGTLHRQLDHIFYDARLDVLSAEVREVGNSDHLPVLAVVTAAKP
jgi:endonuclease/exonuclease/phosphatase (EEP) superfamily protein YafD